MTRRHRIAQIAENRNPKSPENPTQGRRFLRYRLLHPHRSSAQFNRLAVLHGRLRTTIIPASPGTRAIVFGMRDYDTVPDDGQPVFDRTELTVIAWAIQEIGDLGVG